MKGARPWVRRVGIGGAAATLLVTAYSAGGVHEGRALDVGSGGWHLCQSGGEEPKTFGQASLRNRTGADATLTSVTLVGADGLELLGAALVPPDGDPGSLVWSGWPPAYPGAEEVLATTGQKIPGAVLAPGEEWSLWVGVQAPTRTGDSHQVRVEYVHGGEELVQVVDHAFIVRPTCDDL